MEIKIKCPTCGKILRVADSPKIDNSTFTCPVCKEKHKVGNCQRYVEPPKQKIVSEETQYGFASSSSADTDATQYIGAPTPAAIGYLLDGAGRKYQLSSGINTVGRKGTTSKATVQIEVDNNFMSRNHAIIEVKVAGGQTLHIIRNDANKNPSYLNGKIIEADDQLILNDGDRLKFGKTELTFKK